MTVVRVAVSVPLPQLFDYLAEDATTADIGRCVRVPFGRGEKSGLILALPETAGLDPERLKPVIHIQRNVPRLPPDWMELVEFTARYYHAPPGEVVALALPPGLRQADAVRSDEPDPALTLTDAGRAALFERRRDSRALALVRELAARGEHAPTLRRSAIRRLAAGSATGDALARGWLAVSPDAPRERHRTNAPPSLTDAQADVLGICRAAPAGFVVWLLAGVTGSGKTEIYLRLAADVLAAGGQVLMLVPEIALTPQQEERVRARFPAACVVSLHSELAAGARARGFRQALDGRADIVLGTRLAVFTPLPRLGLILVDEEHDASYKQQEGVRYSARDLAVWRARQRDVPVMLGSATPSLESWWHAQSNRYHLLSLPVRALSSALPTVRIIDTRRCQLDEGISPPLREAIAARLDRGEQSLVFLNRRGYAPVLSCTACGWVSQCPHCSANRVVHLTDRRLRCHHCGADSPIPRACPVCGNQDIQPFGRGTQRVETRLAELFPTARVLRIDRDAARSPARRESLLASIASGEADILVGTQMMAKGHDFPGLTLVGVLGADASLHAADFRAPERLFQQMMQVGGRAGRAELPGEVLIQTEYPAHPIYRCLIRHDFDAFARMELDCRLAANFPPFSRQAMLRADAPELAAAMDFLRRAKEEAAPFAASAIRLFDPVPMRLTRLARRERAQLLIESDQRAALQDFLTRWLERIRALRTPRELRWQVDVDPLEV